MLPPKLRPILGVFGFLRKKFRQKKDPTLVMLLFENTMGNPFFFYINRNSSKKIYNRNMGILFSNLLSESIFDFGKWSNLKYANMCICVLSIWPFPEVKLIPKADLKREYQYFYKFLQIHMEKKYLIIHFFLNGMYIV